MSEKKGDEPTFAEAWWDFSFRKSRWEESLSDLLPEKADFERIGTDDYDSSLEIHGATNDLRLGEQVQRLIDAAGFGKVYLNHLDGWETHYTFSVDQEIPVRGWRRRYVSDAAASTTRVLVGEEDNGYYEISHWPESWTSPTSKEWLTTGYMRIVPDPLESTTTERKR